jgi:hypothetical protein
MSTPGFDSHAPPAIEAAFRQNDEGGKLLEGQVNEPTETGVTARIRWRGATTSPSTGKGASE